MTKLEELVGIIGGESVYIQTHNYPDQDALASAYGLKYLLAAKGIPSTIIILEVSSICSSSSI